MKVWLFTGSIALETIVLDIALIVWCTVKGCWSWSTVNTLLGTVPLTVTFLFIAYIDYFDKELPSRTTNKSVR